MGAGGEEMEQMMGHRPEGGDNSFATLLGGNWVLLSFGERLGKQALGG